MYLKLRLFRVVHSRKGELTMYKLMLIEDDTQLSKLIQESLERYGYIVHQPENFINIVEDFTKIKPDLVLLDINLPIMMAIFYAEVFASNRMFQS